MLLVNITPKNSVFAETKKEYTIENLENKKKNFEIEFLKSKNVDNIDKLNEKDINNYMYEIEKIKNEYFSNNPSLIKFKPEKRAPSGYLPTWLPRNRYTGDVYVTHDKTWQKGNYFGHAGLGGYETDTVFEMSPSSGLILSKGKNGHNRWKSYKSGGRYEVRGAKKVHYDGAADYAYWKLWQGLKYSIRGDGKTSDYCSGFVYRACKSEGFDLSNENWIKPNIAPWDLSRDNDTILMESFGK